METQTAGRIRVTAKVERLPDLYMIEKGLLPADQVPIHGNTRSVCGYGRDDPFDAEAACGSRKPRRPAGSTPKGPVHTKNAIAADLLVFVRPQCWRIVSAESSALLPSGILI
jgi:hypothetical protein